jgi:glycosyltransferase involved in cell wall biosynthesis
MNLTLFFTYGISLKIWAETGLIEREILLYKSLIEKGVDVAFVTYGDEEDYAYQEELSSIEIIPFYAYTKKPRKKITGLLHSLFLPFILRKKIKRADIIKTNQMWGSWAAVLSKLFFKKRLVVRCGYEFYKNTFIREHSITQNRAFIHHFLYKIFGFILEFISYHSADRIIVNNLSNLRFISRNFKVRTTKITLLRNYINTDQFKPLNVKRKMRNRLLFVGRLHPVKNITGLLNALDGLNIGLDIVGKGQQERELRSFAENNDLDVNFFGVVPNSRLPELINRYSIYILPSLFENNPKTLLESMACGIAVIGSNVEGIKEIIKHKANGLICETDAESISQAINTLIHNKRLRERVGRNARSFILNNCSLDRIVDKEYSLYKELIAI